MYKILPFLQLVLAALLGGVISLTGYIWLQKPAKPLATIQPSAAGYARPSNHKTAPENPVFYSAARSASRAVVHIKVHYASAFNGEEREPWEEMFGGNPHYGGRQHARQSSGSGVIITSSGYIVTNHHVIDEAQRIEVILYDKRSLQAKVIGTDRSTDLALLKIEAENLPYIEYGNSDRVEIGDWVLAIGNPFDLTSTVTAGIVSAKGRSINLLAERDAYAIEAFIQTDAAVNPGNSGGALVNMHGELVGINTAIATNTYYYAGYSFAVPINLVRKVMDDLLNYGETQRALLDITIQGVDAELARKYALPEITGVYIKEIKANGAAYTAGIRLGDVIIAIDDKEVHSAPDLQSMVGLYRPGDRVKITVRRGNAKRDFEVVLRNKLGKTELITHDKAEVLDVLGAEFSKLAPEEKQRLQLNYGVKVRNAGAGKLKSVGIRAGFVLLKIGDKPIFGLRDLDRAIREHQHKRKTLAIEGIYPNGTKYYYAIAWEDE